MAVLPAGLGLQVLGVDGVFLVLSSAAVLLRCYCRVFAVKSFGFDDWSALTAWVYCTVSYVGWTEVDMSSRSSSYVTAYSQSLLCTTDPGNIRAHFQQKKFPPESGYAVLRPPDRSDLYVRSHILLG